MVDHQGKFIILVLMARVLVFISTVISYSLVYDDTDVMDGDNVATTLEDQIQINTALIEMVRKPSIAPIINPWHILCSQTL